MTVSNQNCDIVIVGGGPSSLWLGDQIKLLKPELQIVVLEKREQYLRTHPVKLKPRSLSGTPNDARLEQIIAKFKEKKFCMINEIEENLKKLAVELGIDVRTEEVTNPAELIQRFPMAKAFIGADGANSVVRRGIFKNELSFQQKLQYIVEVKYEVLGKAEPLNPALHLLPAQMKAHTLVNENISSEKNGRSTITLQFFVDQNVYEQMKPASFATPYTLTSHQHLIPPSLLRNINNWLNKRQAVFDEKRIDNSEKIAAILLSIYATKTFVMEGARPGTTWSLVGDAAFGVPFFRSMNTSFLSGTELAKKVVSSFDPPNPFMHRIVVPIQRWIAGDAIEGNIPDPFISYAAYIRCLCYLEALGARIKAIGIEILRAVLSVCPDPLVPARVRTQYGLRPL